MDSWEFAGLNELLCEVFKKVTGQETGHVHFMYKGKKDHLILVLSDRKRKKIVAKGPDCKKGECMDWSESEFSDFSPKDAFLKFSDQIDRIVIDSPKLKKDWKSMDDFMNWLEEISNLEVKKEN